MYIVLYLCKYYNTINYLKIDGLLAIKYLGFGLSLGIV